MPQLAQKWAPAISLTNLESYVAAPLRTVCLSSPQLRGRPQQLSSSVQQIDFTPLFSEREQVSLAGTTEISAQECSGLQTGLTLAEIVVG